MMLDTDYVELLATHRPAKPHNRQELAEMTALLETLAANEKPQTPAMERFIETTHGASLTVRGRNPRSPRCLAIRRLEIFDGRTWRAAGGSGANPGQQVIREPDPFRAPADRQGGSR
jgi:hypothetical protein